MQTHNEMQKKSEYDDTMPQDSQDAALTRLLSSPESGVLERRHLVPWDEQMKMYETLVADGPWAQRENVLWGKTVLQPRVSFLWGLEYSYSGGVNRPAPDLPASVKDVLMRLKEMVEATVKQHFGRPQTLNTALVQLYRDENDCIFPHCDNEREFKAGEATSVTIVTLTPETRESALRVLRFSASGGDGGSASGAPPEYTIHTQFGPVKKRVDNHRKLADVALRGGQLLAMHGNMTHLRHEVPRMTKTHVAKCDNRISGRISVSFRTFST